MDVSAALGVGGRYLLVVSRELGNLDFGRGGTHHREQREGTRGCRAPDSGRGVFSLKRTLLPRVGAGW